MSATLQIAPANQPAVVNLRGERAPRALLRLRRTPMVVAGAVIVVAVVIAAAFAGQLAPHDPLLPRPEVRLAPPLWLGGSLAYPLGADELGRDILSRLLFGARVSMSLGVAAVAIAGTVGVLAGLVAAYYAGWVDDVIMRLADIQLCFPVVLLAMAVVVVVGAGAGPLLAVMALSGWVVYARITRGAVLSIKNRDYVTAARVVGQRDLAILLKHILPNCFAPILVVATVQIGQMIILESGLSFFGLGTQPPTASWGLMLAEGRNYLANAWWVATMPGLAISLTILGANLLGDGLRDMLDPRLNVD